MLSPFAKLNTIHELYGLKKRIIGTVTDNASNFKKAFKEFGFNHVSENFEIDDEELVDGEYYEMTPFLVTETRLPKHFLCATHILSLIVTADMGKYINSKDQFKKNI